jgi:hypothetical protein
MGSKHWIGACKGKFVKTGIIRRQVVDKWGSYLSQGGGKGHGPALFSVCGACSFVEMVVYHNAQEASYYPSGSG